MNFSNTFYAPFLALKELEQQFLKDNIRHSQEPRKLRFPIGRLLHTVKNKMISSYKERAAMRELQTLDDRTLHDIGLDRSQVNALVAGLISAEAIEAEREQLRNRFNRRQAPVINADSCQTTSVAVAGSTANNDDCYNDTAA